MPQATPTPAPVKHRACDECRTRKLACSKDPDGCERCNREGIVCHYSEQKPMGRPRKRQFIEASTQEELLDSNPIDSGPASYIVGNMDLYKNDGSVDPAFMESFIEAGAPYLRGLGSTTEKDLGDTPRARWNFGDGNMFAGPPIDFGNVVVPPAESTPQLSNESNPSLSDSGNSPASIVPCSCLASMYLALSSLQTLPTEIVEALKTVRTAAQTAAETIWCPQCGYVVLENPSPPIESFQNTMLLGTLLPIIANAYQRLLKMIDAETDAAEAAGKTKTFQFSNYGGLCGRQDSVPKALTCVAKDLFFNAVEMPPHQWRATVRALLRIDIYGHEQGGLKHKGLKDLLNEMESRQRARHDMLDAHAAAGIPISGHGLFARDCSRPQQTSLHTCLQILNIAKVAIDNLVIP